MMADESTQKEQDTLPARQLANDSTKLILFLLLVSSGLLLEGVFHYLYDITVVYTQFYYLIVIIAGLWYGRGAIIVALFFGTLEIGISLIKEPGIIPYDPIFRTLLLLMVAGIIWKIFEDIKRYENQSSVQNQELLEINRQLDASQKALLAAHKKLNLLSSVTRHDIKNQLTALSAYLDLCRMMELSPELYAIVDKEELVANNILRQIDFTKTYDEIGVLAPQWNNISQIITILAPMIVSHLINLQILTGDLEIFGDPLLEKVFENLIDNSLRHGDHVRNITIMYEKHLDKGLTLVFADDGIGVANEEKQKIFEKGVGKNTGLGLFICQEILSISGLTIRECGQFGRGIRFEIDVPESTYRFANNLLS